MLSLHNISVSIVNGAPILHNISLTIEKGTVHALMGPNGSGKSTCAYTIMGHPYYQVNHGSVQIDGTDITDASPDKRAQHGIFLAMQQPCALPGVSLLIFLKEIHFAITKQAMDMSAFEQLVRLHMATVSLDPSCLYRSVNDGFSGGERKRCELLQMLILSPKYIILDEIDSGLDIDALKQMSVVIQQLRLQQPDLAIVMITHYQRLLQYIKPDYVHVLIHGHLIRSGDYQLVQQIEQKGYDELCV